jgi:aspartate aminotransferase
VPAVEMRPSERGLALPSSPIRRLASLAAAATTRGVYVHHLNIGQPDLAPPPEVIRALEQASEIRLAYAPSRGLPDTIDAWIAYYRTYGIEVEAEDMLVTAGASEALALALLTTCDPGDEVLVPEPFYAPYKGVAAIYGVRLVPVPLGEGYSPPPVHAFRLRATNRTRGIILCSPNNPTGTVYQREHLIAVGEFARETGLFILSDETYREIVFNGPPATSALTIQELEDVVIVIDSLSKRFNMCGARVGSFVTRNRPIMAAALEIAELRLAVPAIEQHAAAAALSAAPGYLTDLVETYRDRVEVVAHGLGLLPGVEVRRPDGGFYVVPRLPVDDAERFAAWLLTDFSEQDETVMVTPMSDFYGTAGLGSREVRIACIVNDEELIRAVDILAAGLASYPGRMP